MHPDYEAPFAKHQAKGVLALVDDSAQKLYSEGMGVSAKSPKMPFVLRPAGTGKQLDWMRWWLDIPSQGVSLRFDPAPHGELMSSYQVQKGPRTHAAKKYTEQEYRGIVTQKEQINGTWVVVKDSKGLFKPHAKSLSGFIFFTSSNAGVCVSDFVSARVSIATPWKDGGGKRDVYIELSGEAKNISAYAPATKP